MRFEIAQEGGTPHEVEPPGSVVVLGRDPGCDVVLNDPKCSRRHAVVEEAPGGPEIRDSGSANGILLNGRRVEKATLQPGDVIRLGDTQITFLGEAGATVVMATEDVEDPRSSAPAVPPPPLRPSPPRAAAKGPPGPARAPRARPATVGVLAILWAVFAPASVTACLLFAHRVGGLVAWTLAGLSSLVLAGLGATMALGLRALAPWARHLQVAAAAVGLVICPFTLAAATVLLYMARPEVKAAFEAGAGAAGPSMDATTEATFALSILGMLVLGSALTAIAALFL